MDVTTSLWISKPWESLSLLGCAVTGSNLSRLASSSLQKFAHLIPEVAVPIEQVSGTADCVKILLIDDSRMMLRENQRVLHKAGYEVVCADDGVSALRLARELKPDLILLDMILPKMSGPEVLHVLKSTPATADIPVVVLSALTEKNRQKLIEAGAEDYVEKSSLMPSPGVNLLPKILETLICRINRKRGVAFTSIPVDQ